MVIATARPVQRICTPAPLLTLATNRGIRTTLGPAGPLVSSFSFRRASLLGNCAPLSRRPASATQRNPAGPGAAHIGPDRGRGARSRYAREDPAGSLGDHLHHRDLTVVPIDPMPTDPFQHRAERGTRLRTRSSQLCGNRRHGVRAESHPLSSGRGCQSGASSRTKESVETRIA